MATLNTDVATAQASPNVKDRVDGNSVTGQIRYAEAVFTTPAAPSTLLASGDVINIVTLPVGAIVLPERSWVANEALAGTSTVISKIGDSADDDRYSATSISLVSAGSVAVTAAAATSVVVRTPVTKDTNTLKATVTFTGAVTTGVKVRFSIAYILP